MKCCKRLICGLLLAPLWAAAADSNDGFYVDGSFGHAAVVGDSYFKPFNSAPHSPMWNVDAGYHWDWLGVEVGYVDFTGESRFSNEPVPVGVYDRLLGKTAGLSGHWNLSHWYVGARAGVFFSHTEVMNFGAPTEPVSSILHSHDTSWYAGIGAGYDFNDHFGVGLRYELYHTGLHTTHVPSLTVEYRF